MSKGQKILAFDIETGPVLAYVWGLGDQYVGIEQIHTDWTIMSFAAKWVGESGMFYVDRRNAKSEKPVLEALWKLLNEADIVLTQNGKNFDCKKVNAKFLEYKMRPPAPYRHIDTLQIARKIFGFTSNKLAYVSDKFCKHKKSEHKKFPGLELWKECLDGNKEAWNELEKYNKQDVIALEDWYNEIAAWDTSVDRSDRGRCRNCDGVNLQSRGYAQTVAGKYARYQCTDCGAWMRDNVNVLSKDERAKKLRAV